MLKKSTLLLTVIGSLLIIGLTVYWLNIRVENSPGGEQVTTQKQKSSETDAIKAGKQLSNNRCSGQGATKLTQLPMKQDDYSVILPYGLMVGGHVTPIDHQYFSPRDY